YEFVSGVIFITIYLILTDNIISLNIENYLSLNYLYIFILGSVCTAYAFIASVYLLKFITPYSVVLTYNLEPIYGILLALLFFGDNEKMSFQFYIGLFLILSSVLINMYVKKTLNKG
ncbi:MAG: EamA family transporter, partial [Flavobacteriaceae bacterium]|nr:EamA family transporter [Flavobacteriaceae bacterium]